MHEEQVVEYTGRLRQRADLEEELIVADDFVSVVPSLRSGDCVVVCSLSEICRSVTSLLRVLQELNALGVTLESEDEPWLDMSSDACNWNELLQGLLSFSHRINSEKARQGLSRTRAKGGRVGRPKGFSSAVLRKIDACLSMYRHSDLPVQEICRMAGIHPRTLYRYMRTHDIPYARRPGPVVRRKLKA